MELREVIEKRASIRRFMPDAVPENALREMVRLAGMAPSANNSQPWKFIAVTDKEVLKCMSASVHTKIEKLLPEPPDESSKKAKSQVDWFSTFFVDAPAVICVFSHPYEAVVDKAISRVSLTHQDINAMRGYPDIQSIGAAVQNLLLAALDIGYGTCWLSGPLVAREEIEACLDIQTPWRLAAMVAVGKPFGDATQREKKPMEEIFELRN